jgi:hypothetical protein
MRTTILFIVSILAACTDSKMKQFCERADECNALNTSVQECVDNLESQRDQLTPSSQGELDLQVQMCLDHPSCDGFRSCVAAWSK